MRAASLIALIAFGGCGAQLGGGGDLVDAGGDAAIADAPIDAAPLGPFGAPRTTRR
jgi:hypothetical protein